MKILALLAIAAVSTGASAPGSSLPLQALTEADVGADALSAAACYVHEGTNVLLVATKKNAVVSNDGDLLMLSRSGGHGFPGDGARYRGNNFEVVIAPAQGEGTGGDRTDRAARISVGTSGNTHSMTARWSCGSPG